MVYEWDARRARRVQLGKLGLALIVACGFFALGSWVLSII
jgi:ABC-type transporter Mla subunit MlaD